MFKDKVYEDLDDISRLVEPFQSKINEELAQFPDELEITKEMVLETSSEWGWNSIRTSSLISQEAFKLGLTEVQTKAYDIARKFFKIEVRDHEEGEQVTIDFKTGEMSHKIFMVKTKLGYDDTELEKIARHNIVRTIKHNLSNNKSVNKPRLNEIADLFNAHEVKSDRSYKGKVRKFCKHLELLMDDRKLDIKDLELCARFGNWIALYVTNGNLPALNNITRIKIMMHENRPIYSIEERAV